MDAWLSLLVSLGDSHHLFMYVEIRVEVIASSSPLIWVRARASQSSCKPLDVGSLQNAQVRGLDSRKTIPARVNAQVTLPSAVWRPAVGIAPAMVAPRLRSAIFRRVP